MNSYKLTNYLELMWSKSQIYATRFANFVASLSFWQFIGFCLLILIASGIIEEVISDKHSRVKVIAIKDDKDKKAEKSKEISIDINSRKPPSNSVKIPNESLTSANNSSNITQETKQINSEEQKSETVSAENNSSINNLPSNNSNANSSNEQFKIVINEDEIRITGSGDPSKYVNLQKDLQNGFERLQKRGDQLESNDRSYKLSLPSLTMLLIIIMLIIRLTARAKIRAETKASNALIAAESADLARQLAEAKLQTMQAQIEPHFLFNTLAAVEHLIETSPAKAAVMQRHLIAYLRSVLPNLREKDSTIAKELDIARNYLEVLKFRMEERLSFKIICPDGLLSAKIPPMMLPTLVENAIKHGLEPKAEGGKIIINVSVTNGKLLLEVSDSGVGFDPQRASTSKGIGLTNLRERLLAIYKDQASLEISSNQPSGTKFSIMIPYSYGFTLEK